MKSNIVKFSRPVKFSFCYGIVLCEITSYTYGYDLITLLVSNDEMHFITDADKSWMYAQQLIGDAISFNVPFTLPDGVCYLDNFSRL
jgi:hypothetical protein